jgi:hypothetical protein
MPPDGAIRNAPSGKDTGVISMDWCRKTGGILISRASLEWSNRCAKPFPTECRLWALIDG